MSSEPVATTARPTDVGLKREMGLIGALWASETSIIGSGWLFGVLAATILGSAAIIGWLFAGIVFIVLALVYAELGAMYPIAGGTARFPHLAFGSVAGASFGFFAWLQAVTVAPIECFAVMQYAQYYLHGIYDPVTKNVTASGFLLTILLMAIFTAINFLGMRQFSRVNSGITYWKVAIPVLTIIILLFKFHTSNLSAGGGFFPHGVGAKLLFATIPPAGIVFAYLGFEQADQLAAEVKNPQRNLPRAIIGAILIGTAIYVLLQFVWIGAVPTHFVSGSKGFAGIPTTDQLIIAPFAGVAAAVGLGAWATILRIDAFISPFGTGLIYVTSTSRVGYGLARNRYFPPVFTKTDANGVPWVSLIVAFVFGLVFLLPFPSWHALVGLVTGASVLMYAGAPLSLTAFRRQVPEANRPYRLPGAAVLSPLAFIIANLLIYWSGFQVVWKLGVCIVIGYIIIGIFMALDKDRPPLDWKSAQWLPVYLIVMGIISWQGQFSGGAVLAPLNTGRIPFWVDIGVVAAFSLVIFYWAQAVRLPREELERLVAKQAGGAEDLEAHA